MAAPVGPAAAGLGVVEAIAERGTVRLDFDAETGAAQDDPLDGDAEAATVDWRAFNLPRYSTARGQDNRSAAVGHREAVQAAVGNQLRPDGFAVDDEV